MGKRKTRKTRKRRRSKRGSGKDADGWYSLPLGMGKVFLGAEQCAWYGQKCSRTKCTPTQQVKKKKNEEKCSERLEEKSNKFEPFSVTWSWGKPSGLQAGKTTKVLPKTISEKELITFSDITYEGEWELDVYYIEYQEACSSTGGPRWALSKLDKCVVTGDGGGGFSVKHDNHTDAIVINTAGGTLDLSWGTKGPYEAPMGAFLVDARGLPSGGKRKRKSRRKRTKKKRKRKGTKKRRRRR